MPSSRETRQRFALRIYISSTVLDLSEYRLAVYQTLRRMGHDVIAMEDAVTADQRPLDQSTQDVADSNVYVGLFGWRYGYIPQGDNPENRSITELEYRTARTLKIPCLVFLLNEDAPWPRSFMDEVTAEGNSGERIKALREELKKEHGISVFNTPDELSRQVNEAVTRVQMEYALSKMYNHDTSALPGTEIIGALPYLAVPQVTTFTPERIPRYRSIVDPQLKLLSARFELEHRLAELANALGLYASTPVEDLVGEFCRQRLFSHGVAEGIRAFLDLGNRVARGAVVAPTLFERDKDDRLGELLYSISALARRETASKARVQATPLDAETAHPGG